MKTANQNRSGVLAAAFALALAPLTPVPASANVLATLYENGAWSVELRETNQGVLYCSLFTFSGSGIYLSVTPTPGRTRFFVAFPEGSLRRSFERLNTVEADYTLHLEIDDLGAWVMEGTANLLDDTAWFWITHEEGLEGFLGEFSSGAVLKMLNVKTGDTFEAFSLRGSSAALDSLAECGRLTGPRA